MRVDAPGLGQPQASTGSPILLRPFAPVGTSNEAGTTASRQAQDTYTEAVALSGAASPTRKRLVSQSAPRS